jgi:hypothetical protein
MASTYVNDLRLNEMATGDASGSWGTVTNTNLELIGEAFSYGTETIGDADSTLTIADGAADAARSFYLKITSSVDLTTTRIVTLGPNTVSKVWMIENATTGSQVITIKQGSGATINVPNGQVKMISTDGAGSGGAVLDLLVDVDLTGTTTLVNLDVSGAVDIAGDLTLSAGGDGALRFTAASSVKVLDNNAAALVFEEADNAYMTFVTTDGSEAVKFDKALDINAATQIDATVTVGVDDTGYDVKFFGATAGAYMLWDESADDLILGGAAGLSVNSAALVTGVLTTTAATVSNGGGQFNGAINVGVDDTGYDVKFFGATAGAYMLWDESADDLILGGAAGLSVNSAALVTGVLTTTAATVFNGGFASNAVSTITTADNTSQLTLISTDADASGGPVLDFFRNSASPADGDDTGQIRLQGKNDAGETISYVSMGSQIADMTDGTEDGKFYINTVLGGSNVSRIYMTDTETIFNDSASDLDFRVESATDANALFVQGSDGFVGIGTSSPASKLQVGWGSDQLQFTNPSAGKKRIGASYTGYVSDNIYASMDLQSAGSSGGDISFNTTPSGGSLTERLRIDESGRVLIGYTANTPVADFNSATQVVGQGTADYHGASSSIIGFSNNSNGSYLNFASGRSDTAGTYTIVANDDTIGQINFAAADGTDMASRAALIQCQVDGDPGANDMPGRLQFFTTADGASSPTERMRISANGAMLFDVESGGIMAMSVGTSAGVATDCFEINLSGATFACYVDVVTNQSAGYAGRTSQFLWYGRRAGAGNSRGTVELSTNSLGSVNAGVVAVATITASATNPTGTLERFQITTDLATDSIYCIIRAIGNIPTLKILN